jgi:hypothetical protein
MSYTRGYMLRHSLAFALRTVKLQLGRRFLPVRLTEEQRFDIAGQVVRDLKNYNDPWKLDENVPEYKLPPADPT